LASRLYYHRARAYDDIILIDSAGAAGAAVEPVGLYTAAIVSRLVYQSVKPHCRKP